MKAIFGLWADVKIHQINRLLRPYGVRLVLKHSRDWGDQVSITAHPLANSDEAPVQRGIPISTPAPGGSK